MKLNSIGTLLSNVIRDRVVSLLGILLATVLVAAAAAIYIVSAAATPLNANEQRLTALVNQLDDEQLTAQRHLAQQQLEKAGPESIGPLTVGLHSSNATLRRNSAEMLGFIGSPAATEALSDRLTQDPVPAVRARAAWALGELDDARAIRVLERAAVADEDLKVRQEASASLNALRDHYANAAGKNQRQVVAFAASPAQPNVIYLAEQNRILVSRDAGKTWIAAGGSVPNRITALTVSPARPETIYAGTEAMGIYKSTDAGATWVQFTKSLPGSAGAPIEITAIAVDQGNSEHIYVAVSAWIGSGRASTMPVGVFSSKDGGNSWERVKFSATETPITRLFVDGNTLYAGFGDEVISTAAY